MLSSTQATKAGLWRADGVPTALNRGGSANGGTHPHGLVGLEGHDERHAADEDVHGLAEPLHGGSGALAQCEVEHASKTRRGASEPAYVLWVTIRIVIVARMQACAQAAHATGTRRWLRLEKMRNPPHRCGSLRDELNSQQHSRLDRQAFVENGVELAVGLAL